MRFPIDAAELVTTIGAGAADYFASVSHGALRLRFESGGDVMMTIDDGPQQCVAHARAGTVPGEVVLAVADAEHAADQPGGFGVAGDASTAGAAYIGANDVADPSTPPPLDLVEHELGHALGWVHSGDDGTAEVSGRYRCATDVMSDSAAPRSVDATRRDGPDTLAIDRYLVGWIPRTEVAVVGGSRGSVALAPSTGGVVEGAHRLAVVPLDDGRFATVEVLDAAGYDAHLPETGVAVHVVTVIGGAVTAIEPVHDDSPCTDLLGAGDSLDIPGHELRVGVAVDGVVTVVVAAR